MSKNWYVYIIESSDSLLYTGVTTDMTRRWHEHCGNATGIYKGAKFFRGRKPKKLVFLSKRLSRSAACKSESSIKKLSRKHKISLIQSNENELESLKITILLKDDCF